MFPSPVEADARLAISRALIRIGPQTIDPHSSGAVLPPINGRNWQWRANMVLMNLAPFLGSRRRADTILRPFGSILSVVIIYIMRQ